MCDAVMTHILPDWSRYTRTQASRLRRRNMAVSVRVVHLGSTVVMVFRSNTSRNSS